MPKKIIRNVQHEIWTCETCGIEHNRQSWALNCEATHILENKRKNCKHEFKYNADSDYDIYARIGIDRVCINCQKTNSLSIDFGYLTQEELKTIFDRNFEE